MTTIIDKVLSGSVEIARGMYTIVKHAFRPAITLEYPEKRPQLNSRFHGRPALLVNPDGSDICLGCKSCMKVCPCNDLIYIETKKMKITNSQLKNLLLTWVDAYFVETVRKFVLKVLLL